MNILKDKNILLGITGSIAVYKAAELARLYIKAGANVKVLMTKDAKRFVTPLTFEALTGNEVLDENSESWKNEYNHIHITKWADIFVIAPATAHTINKLANGFADNLLCQSALANTKPLLIAPAANTNMMMHPSTQNSLEVLRSRGAIIVESVEKLLACNDIGKGALANPETIFLETSKALHIDKFWNGKDVVITGGGTVEKIDDVRCLSNFSSGKMAHALAHAFYLKGANVTLISSSIDHSPNLPVKKVFFQNSSSLKEEIQSNITKGSYLFMAAAVSDYIPTCKENGKLKKSELGEKYSLELRQNEDILASIEKKDIKTIGFKAEMDKSKALENAKSMLALKNLDAVCLNILDENLTFGSEMSKITFITKEDTKELKLCDKLSISLKLTEYTKNL